MIKYRQQYLLKKIRIVESNISRIKEDIIKQRKNNLCIDSLVKDLRREYDTFDIIAKESYYIWETLVRRNDKKEVKNKLWKIFYHKKYEQYKESVHEFYDDLIKYELEKIAINRNKLLNNMTKEEIYKQEKRVSDSKNILKRIEDCKHNIKVLQDTLLKLNNSFLTIAGTHNHPFVIFRIDDLKIVADEGGRIYETINFINKLIDLENIKINHLENQLKEI